MNTLTHQLAAPEKRLYAFLANMGIGIITLGIGWIIWSALLWSEGTTPGHKLLNLSIVDEKTFEHLNWNRMAVRELVFKGIFAAAISSFTYGLSYIADGLFIFRDDRRALHDHLARSIVIDNESQGSRRIRFTYE